jgi:DNA primase
VAGRINPEDLEQVRSRARIDDVVSAHVTLKPAGSGSLKGLCPFHDEKTPSFQVTPARGLYYCFGCGEGGDVIDFVEKINNLSFSEAVEFLAEKYGVRLRRTDDRDNERRGPTRARLLAANAASAAYYAAQLATPDAREGQKLLEERRFTAEDAARFGVGFAPRQGRALAGHLRSQGFTDEEMLAAGLIRKGGWDYFQGRLLWPIKDAGESVLGFGGRRLFDDDRMPAKYINTPETQLYKKSHVLYGLDLARVPIGRKQQAVIVEGYTDVMACHLAGLDTAVASCGTAFGEDHARLIQRLLGGDAVNGEVIFTFDGDEAGQKAALKVFSGDQHFAAQTYVAVEPNGLDPCDLRLSQGDAAVRELVGRREPLYLFVMRNVVSQFDLDRSDGRLGAVRAAAPLVGSVRDHSLRDAYFRDLAALVGMDVAEVGRVAGQTIRRTPRRNAPPHQADPFAEGRDARGNGKALPDPTDRRLSVERGVLGFILQRPDLFTNEEPWYGVTADDFTHPAYRHLFTIVAAHTTPEALADWPRPVVDAVTDDALRSMTIQLAVENLQAEPTPKHCLEYCSKLKLLTLTRVLDELKSKMQRTNPVTEAENYHGLFARMIDLETKRKELLRLTIGE